MATFTVSFFGHRLLSDSFYTERRLEKLVSRLLQKKEYVEFLVGRNGDFDILVSSVVQRAKHKVRCDNSALVLVLPYATAEFVNNENYFNEFYDEVEICPASSGTHFKTAIQLRNMNMVDRSDLVIFYVERDSGGAYRTLKYAQKQKRKVLNLAVDPQTEDLSNFPDISK